MPFTMSLSNVDFSTVHSLYIFTAYLILTVHEIYHNVYSVITQYYTYIYVY